MTQHDPDQRSTLHIVVRHHDDPDQRPLSRPVRFHAWNTLGWLAMTAGRGLHRAGLTLCGCAGWLDAVADGHR